jgi:hypothetical protein
MKGHEGTQIHSSKDTEESATWTTNSENEMATKRHKRRKNNDSFAHLAPSCGYPFVFHLAVLSVFACHWCLVVSIRGSVAQKKEPGLLPAP